MLRLKVREIAEAQGISRTRLSRLADTNYKTINALWNDPYRNVDTDVLNRVAKALGVATLDLLEEVPDDTKK